MTLPNTLKTVGLALWLAGSGLNAGTLDHWTFREALPADTLTDGLVAVAFGNGTFVAVGGYNTATEYILTSTDGVSWTERNAGTTTALFPRLFGITYGGGLFVAVGDSGVILTSHDGATWRRQSTGANTFLFSVAYGGGRFVAAGRSAAALVSSNGTLWTPYPVGLPIISVTYGNGLFVGLTEGQPSIVVTSPDGATWTVRTNFAVRAVAYGNGGFVAVGSDIVTSPDGVTWTAQNSGIGEELRTVAFANGTFIAAAEFSGTIALSADGVAWNITPLATGSYSSIAGIAFGNGRFVAVGAPECGNDTVCPGIYVSSNGVNWTASASPNVLPNAATYGNGTFVAVGEGGGRWTSTDGLRWVPQEIAPGLSLRAITFADSQFVAVGGNPDNAPVTCVIATSSNGVAWTERTLGTGPPLQAVCHGDGRFVATAPGKILTSTDAVVWAEQAGPGGSGIAYGNGLFVTAYIPISTSSDGLTWAVRTNINNAQAVAFGAGQFVVVGVDCCGDGYAMVSSDGITWTRHSVNEHEDPIDSMPAMVFGDGKFETVGWRGPGSWFILSSPDGITWNRRRLCSASTLSGIAYGSGSYVAVGRTSRSFLPAPGMWRSGGESAPPRFISERTRLTGDIFFFYYGVEVGGHGTFTVEYTTDFRTWTPLWPGFTVDGADCLQYFSSDFAPPDSQRFYRAVLRP